MWTAHGTSAALKIKPGEGRGRKWGGRGTERRRGSIKHQTQQGKTLIDKWLPKEGRGDEEMGEAEPCERTAATRQARSESARDRRSERRQKGGDPLAGTRWEG